MVFTHRYDSPLGGITMAASGDALTGLWFDGQKNFGSTLGSHDEEKPLPVFTEADRWLDLYFGGAAPGFTPKLSIRATVFRAAVYEVLLGVPYGQTMTYGQVAERMSLLAGTGRISPRAVGGAVAHNPVSLIIPCHRIVAADGSLTGYAGGVERKAALLRMEGIL